MERHRGTHIPMFIFLFRVIRITVRMLENERKEELITFNTLSTDGSYSTLNYFMI